MCTRLISLSVALTIMPRNFLFEIRPIPSIEFEQLTALSLFLAIGLLSILATAVSALEIDEPQYNPTVIHPGDDVDVWIDVANDEGSDEIIEDLRISVESNYPFEINRITSYNVCYTKLLR